MQRSLPSPSRRKRTHRQCLGEAAESSAARFLVDRGLVLLDTRFLRRLGELDLVLVEPTTGCIVFAEVRYRGHGSRFGAVASVDARKRARLKVTAAAWLQRHADPQRPARIDVLGLEPLRAAGRHFPSRRPGGDAGDISTWEHYRLTWVRNALEP